MRSPFRPLKVPDPGILDDHRPLVRQIERRGLLPVQGGRCGDEKAEQAGDGFGESPHKAAVCPRGLGKASAETCPKKSLKTG